MARVELAFSQRPEMRGIVTLIDEVIESFVVVILDVEPKNERYSVNTETKVMRTKRTRLRPDSLIRLRAEGVEVIYNIN